MTTGGKGWLVTPGTRLVCDLAEDLGLTVALSEAMAPTNRPLPSACHRDVGTVKASDPLDAVLTGMQRDRVHLRGVADTRGSLAAIVFFEDIIEKLVGEIRDAMQPTSR